MKKDSYGLRWIKPTALRFQHDLRRDIQPTTYGCDMTELRRLDRLTAQRVEVAIVFKEMLGVADAIAYMNENGVPQHIAERVLAGMTTTRTSDAAIVVHCQHDPDTSKPVVVELRGVPGTQERAMAPSSTWPVPSCAIASCSRSGSI